MWEINFQQETGAAFSSTLPIAQVSMRNENRRVKLPLKMLMWLQTCMWRVLWIPNSGRPQLDSQVKYIHVQMLVKTLLSFLVDFEFAILREHQPIHIFYRFSDHVV